MRQAKVYPGLFKDYPDRKGEDWVRRLPKDERQAFSAIGRIFAQHGHLGGVARAQKAKRDRHGRFAPNQPKGQS